jgi:hypothetical protein
MKIKDFFRLMIKLFGLYSLVLAIFTLISQVSGLLSDFSIGYFDWSDTLGYTFIGIAMICFFLWLTFKADFLIEKLKLDRGFSQETISFEKADSTSILKIGCIIIGGFLFLDNLAEFLAGCFYMFKESIQTSVEGMFDTNVRLSSKISLTINFINLIIGYILVTNHTSLVKFLLKEGQPEQGNSEHTHEEK